MRYPSPRSLFRLGLGLVSSGLLIVALAVPMSGQQPGSKPKKDKEPPRTKEEKLRQVKDVFQDSIDWSNVKIEGGEVDQRLTEFLKRIFGVAGAGIAKVGKTTYMIAVGTATVSGPMKPGWVQQRILALNRAELSGRAQMANSIAEAMTSGQFFERFDGYSDAVAAQLKELKKAAEAGAISADQYKEATAVFAAAQVVGAITIKTIEGPNNDEYKVARVLIWQPLLRELALTALSDSDYMLPLEKVRDEDLDQIPQKEEELVRELGTRVYFNKQGQRYYVSYGQAEPLARSKDEISRALEIARSRAELQAKGYLARTLAAEVTSANMDEMTQTLEKMDKAEKKEGLTMGFYQRMESKSTNLKVRGVMKHRDWQYRHPDWKSPVVGVVVVWTPESQSVIKALGLNQRFDVSNPENLAAYLTKRYGKAGSGTKNGKKPGVNDSRDPKKLP